MVEWHEAFRNDAHAADNRHEVCVACPTWNYVKVKVIKVFPDLAGARILWTKEGREIQRGDKASTFVATASGG